MNSRLSGVIIVFFVAFAIEGISRADVRRDFLPQAILSEADVTTVVHLAEACGITDPAEVYTFNIHPSPYFGIGIKSTDVTRGRNVSSVAVIIHSEKWERRRSKLKRHVLLSRGKFWIEVGDISTNIVTTFATPKGIVRVHLDDETSVATADKVLDMLIKGRIQYATGLPESYKHELKRIDFSRPESLGMDKNGFIAAFSPAPMVLLWVHFSLEGNGIKIVGLDKLVS